MSGAQPTHRRQVSPTAAMLFLISTVIVGGLGSAQMWQIGLAPSTIPYQRILAVIIVAELLAYFAILLAQLGGSATTRRVLGGVVLGMLVRVGESALAAVLASPKAAEGFRYALLHYYAEYFPGVLLQIAVTVLLLWLLKSTRRGATPVITPRERADADSERLIEPNARRRAELIEQLMRREGEEEPEDADEEPEEEEHEERPPVEQRVTLVPPVPVQVVLTPPQPAVEEEAEEDALPAEEIPEDDAAEQAEPEQVSEAIQEPEPEYASEPEPDEAPEETTPEEPEHDEALIEETTAEVFDEPVERMLSSRESIMAALEEDDEEAAEDTTVDRLPVMAIDGDAGPRLDGPELRLHLEPPTLLAEEPDQPEPEESEPVEEPVVSTEEDAAQTATDEPEPERAPVAETSVTAEPEFEAAPVAGTPAAADTPVTAEPEFEASPVAATSEPEPEPEPEPVNETPETAKAEPEAGPVDETPETAELEPETAQPVHERGLFTYEVGGERETVAGEPEAEALPAMDFSGVAEALAGAGMPEATLAQASSGRLLTFMPADSWPADGVPELADLLLCAGASLCDVCGLGDFRRMITRIGGGYAAATALRRGDVGVHATVLFAEKANLGVADQALNRLEAALSNVDLPPWPQCDGLEATPAYPDDDLHGRVCPVFEWVPDAAGLMPAAYTVAGRQIVTLTHEPVEADLASVLANGLAACEALGAKLGRRSCDLVVWQGEKGSAACAVADLVGQRVLVCLVRPGKPEAGAVNVQLHQILNGLERIDAGK